MIDESLGQSQEGPVDSNSMNQSTTQNTENAGTMGGESSTMMSGEPVEPVDMGVGGESMGGNIEAEIMVGGGELPIAGNQPMDQDVDPIDILFPDQGGQSCQNPCDCPSGLDCQAGFCVEGDQSVFCCENALW